MGSMKPELFLLSTLLLVSACKKEEAAKPARAEKPAEKAPPKVTISPSGPFETLVLSRGIQLSVPKGAKEVATDHKGVNVVYADGRPFVQLYPYEFGVTFAEIKNASDPNDDVKARFVEEETPTGYVFYKQVDSARMKAMTFQVDVSTKIDNGYWTCSVMATSRADGDDAVTACRTLAKATSAPPAPAAAAPAPAADPTPAKKAAASSTAAPSKPAASKPAAPSKSADAPSKPAPPPSGNAYE